jgi:hypothetical protein
MAETFCADFRSNYIGLFPSGTSVVCKADQKLTTTSQVFTLISDIGSHNSAAQALLTSASTAAPTQTLVTDALKFCCTLENKKAIETQLRQAEEDNTVAKARVSSVQNPAGDVSPRGTTLPFGKPLRSDSVPILLATSLAFLIMAMGLLLNLNNITISYSSPGGGPNLYEQLIQSWYATSWMLIGLTTAASAAAAGGVFYWIYKQHPNWIK